MSYTPDWCPYGCGDTNKVPGLTLEERAERAEARVAELLRPTRGEITNRRASTGSRVVELRARLPELEKLARRTPPKTLLAEKARVEAARSALLVCRAELAVLELRWFDLKVEEAAFRGAP